MLWSSMRPRLFLAGTSRSWSLFCAAYLLPICRASRGAGARSYVRFALRQWSCVSAAILTGTGPFRVLLLSVGCHSYISIRVLSCGPSHVP